MGKHEAPEPTNVPEPLTAPESKARLSQRFGRRALHPITHILALISLHVVALGLLEKTPLLTLLFLH
jgi:hypothetical protein